MPSEKYELSRAKSRVIHCYIGLSILPIGVVAILLADGDGQKHLLVALIWIVFFGPVFGFGLRHWRTKVKTLSTTSQAP